MSKFIVLDVVFHASSLNYDQGSGNIQELKKITKWDGKQYTLVSRYALRHSVLHKASELFPDWKLAGSNELSNKKGVVQATGEQKELIKFPEFDLFGYMITTKNKKKGKGKKSEKETEPEAEETEDSATLVRNAVAAISHAVSLVPFNYDSHFNVNLDVAKRSENPTALNPFTIEEHNSIYVYSIVIDVDRVGKVDDGGESVLDETKKTERIGQLLETVCNLTRQIKGRSEDLSPKLLFVGLYENEPYQSFKDRIALANEYEEEITQTEEKVENGTKIIRRTVKTNKPKFEVYGLNKIDTRDKGAIKTEVRNFLTENYEKKSEVLFYHVPEFNVEFKP